MKFLAQVLLLLFTLFLIVSLSLVIRKESFQNFPNGYENLKYQTWDPELTYNTIGPNPSKDKLETWQYRPDRTLVDYKFYDKNGEKYQQIEPTANSDIGKVSIQVNNQNIVEDVPQPYQTLESFI